MSGDNPWGGGVGRSARRGPAGGKQHLSPKRTREITELEA